jgi:hypothetical protein
MPEKFFKLIVIVSLSLIVSFIIVVPIILWRFIKRKPVLPKGKKIESPKIFYIGILLFGCFALAAFLTSMPYFGSAFLLMLLTCVCGLVAHKRGWRG